MSLLNLTMDETSSISTVSSSDEEDYAIFTENTVILPYDDDPIPRTSATNANLSAQPMDVTIDPDNICDVEERVMGKVSMHVWCKCQNCSTQKLAASAEYRCCHGIVGCNISICTNTCITNNPDYQALTNKAVLENYGPMLQNEMGIKYKCKNTESKNEYFRAVLYRIVVRWLFGRIGWNKHRPLPACIYNDIRSKYDSVQYTGYK